MTAKTATAHHGNSHSETGTWLATDPAVDGSRVNWQDAWDAAEASYDQEENWNGRTEAEDQAADEEAAERAYWRDELAFDRQL